MEINEFLMAICDHWELTEVSDEYQLFDDNGEELRDLQVFKTMDKLIDSVCRRELRDKDLFEGDRMQTIYLGTKTFEKEFSQLMNLRRVKMENEKFAKRN